MLNDLEKTSPEGLRMAVENGMVFLRFDRSGGNRLSLDLLHGFRDLLLELHQSTELRAVILGAAGMDFSFGADLADPKLTNAVAGSREDREAVAALGQSAVDAWAALPVPTVAAARGRIIGAGACFFCTADFQVAAPGAVAQFPEVDRGMHLSWGIVPRLVARYGLSWATQLALGGEAVACEGLPQPPLRIAADPDRSAGELAARLAAKPPLAVRAIKKVLVASAETLRLAAESDAAAFADTVGSEDFAEAMAAWFETRPGVYKAR